MMLRPSTSSSRTCSLSEQRSRSDSAPTHQYSTCSLQLLNMKMVKMINALFNNEMWVAEDRVDEYIAAGHKPAASDAQTTKEPKKASSKKKTGK